MKIAKISQAKEAIARKILAAKINRREAKIAEYVNIEDVRQTKAYNTLYDAREILANYAKAKKIKVRFHSYPQAKYPSQGEDLIGMSVSGKKTGTTNIVSASDTPSVVERINTSLLEDKDGLNYIHQGKMSCEDNFLRRVYRNLEQLAKTVK